MKTTSNSPLYNFVADCYNARGKTVWRDLNPALRTTLATAIRLHMRCDPDDIKRIHNDFDGDYWFCGNSNQKGERIYADAVNAGNTPVCLSFERWQGREAFLWPEASMKPERLCVGSEFHWQGQEVEVTSILEDRIIACSVVRRAKIDTVKRDGKERKVIKRTDRLDGTQHIIVGNEAVENYWAYKGRGDKRFTITHADLMAERKKFDDNRRRWEKLTKTAKDSKELQAVLDLMAADAGPLRHFDTESLRRGFIARKKEIEEAERNSRREEEQKRYEAEAEARRIKDAKTFEADVKRWQKGEDVMRFFNHDYTNSFQDVRLRVKGDKVQTTNGMEVSLTGVKEVLPFILQKRAVGWKPNGKTRTLDEHELKSIDPHQGVIVGCTHFTWKEIDRFSNSLT